MYNKEIYYLLSVLRVLQFRFHREEMTFSWLHFEKVLRWRLIVVTLCTLCMFFVGAVLLPGVFEKARVMRCVGDMKAFGTQILCYHQEHETWPQGENVAELAQEVGWDWSAYLGDRSFETDLHSCIYLKGNIQSPGKAVLIWRSEVFCGRFWKGPHYYELVFNDDGGVSRQIRWLK